MTGLHRASELTTPPGIRSIAALALGLVLLVISLTPGDASQTASAANEGQVSTGSATFVSNITTGTDTGSSKAPRSDAQQQECEPVWRNAPVPETYSAIVVDALSPTDVWAMARTQLLHWDGYTWTAFPYTSSPGEFQVMWPGDVLMEASDSVWAIGNAGILEPAGFYWDGTAWTRLRIPARQDARPAASSEMVIDIELVGPGEAWTMSQFSGSGGASQTVDVCQGALCTKQRTWPWNDPHQVASPWFYDMEGATGDVWVVGRASEEDGSTSSHTEHWNGTEWEVVSAPNIGELIEVRRVGPGDVWAASATGVIHWNGSEWEIVPSPGGAKLLEVVSAIDIWASDDSRIMHWDGSEWKVVPSSGGASRFSVVSADDIWAYRYGTLMHWDGTAWGDVPHPRGDRVLDMVATARNDVWSVGDLGREMGWRVDIWHYTDQQFQDVPQGQPFYSYAQGLACRGIVSGYDCGGEDEPCEPDNLAYFRPGEQIKRGQLAKIVSNSAGYSDTPTTQRFEDVATGSPFHAYVERLAARWVMGGYPCGGPGEPCGEDRKPYFRPNATASRGQISKIVSNARGFNEPAGEQIFADVSPADAFYEWVQRLASRGVVGGYACGSPTEKCDEQGRPYFRPGGDATRGQVTKIVSNTFFPSETALK